MPSWIPGTSGSGSGGGGASSSSQWYNIEVPGQLKTTYGELTGENSQFKEWGFELTRRQRLIGFVSCTIGGFALSLIGSILLFVGALAIFAVLYSVGILVGLVGTGFLIGFLKQCKMMFKPVRIVATIILFVAFAMVWIAAFAIHSEILALVFVIVLWLAYLWYCLSYIPYARDAVKGAVSRVF
ncbi:unnamed protein product [Sympodiomycopsis kandeliae]